MALIASLFALLGRFVGRVLTTTLGWASVLLFGRIPQDRQVWLAVLTFGSLAWVAAVVGILVPDVGSVLLTALPLPDWVPEDLVRLAMLATALVLPAVLGGVTLLMFDPEDRPKGAELLAQVARGYALVPVLAVHARRPRGRRHGPQAHLARPPARGRARPDRRPAGSVRSARRDARGDAPDGRPGRGTPRRVHDPHDAGAVAGPGRRARDRPARARQAHRAARSHRSAVGLPVRSRADGRRRTPSPARAPSWRATCRRRTPGSRRRRRRRRSRIGWQRSNRRIRPLGSPELAEIDRDLLNLTIDQDTFEVLYRRRLQLAVGPELDVRDDAEPAPSPPPEPAASSSRWRLSLGSVIGLVVAALTAIDLALVALRDRLPRRARG